MSSKFNVQKHLKIIASNLQMFSWKLTINFKTYTKVTFNFSVRRRRRRRRSLTLYISGITLYINFIKVKITLDENK